MALHTRPGRPMNHVLLIEDDPRICEIVVRGLGARGFDVTTATDGRGGVQLASSLDVDLILLDLVLPDISGVEVLEHVRAVKPRLPVIALTALDDLGSKINGLDAGADDYVTKPFSVDELAARIRARLRRGEGDETVLRSGPLSVDIVAHRAVLEGREVALSARELSLLATFMQHIGNVLTRQQLLSQVWDIDFDPGSNVVDVHVSALRRKLGPGFIETVRGLGYRFLPWSEGQVEV